MQIGLIGTGLIGGSLGMALRQLGEITVCGYDRDSESLQLAQQLGAVDRQAKTLKEAVESADAVFVALPVGAISSAVTEVLKHAPQDCVVSDVGSTKRSTLEAIEDPRMIGGHPLAGMETSGIAHANAELFSGCTWYLTPTTLTTGMLYQRMHDLIKRLGARPVTLTAEAHDRMLAAVSHLPHVLANVLVDIAAVELAGEDSQLPATGPSFRDATRVAGANSSIWTDIYLTNSDAICEQIQLTVKKLQQVAELLQSQEREQLKDWNDSAADKHRRLLEVDSASKGQTRQLQITVPNQPGVLAELTLKLSQAAVNIDDLALYPAADMNSGVIALWVVGEQSMQRAESLIKQLGYTVIAA